ncbi:MAG TPA: peptidoglycan-binding domain-containing protein [Alphaproteobacteria bacterium]|nr:peptidoglycan-binding domain-containing protein [Alphaproteobacteria bacterium]
MDFERLGARVGEGAEGKAAAEARPKELSAEEAWLDRAWERGRLEKTWRKTKRSSGHRRALYRLLGLVLGLCSIATVAAVLYFGPETVRAFISSAAHRSSLASLSPAASIATAAGFPTAAADPVEGQPAAPVTVPVPPGPVASAGNALTVTPAGSATAALPADGILAMGARVRRAQRLLARLGYYHHRIDGVEGPETFAAVRRYQTMAGLAATGRIDRALLDSLERKIRRGAG